MNEYTWAAAAVLAVVALVAARQGLHRRPWVWLGLAVFAALTVVVDVVLTRAGVYRHRAPFNAGILIDRMPVEDLLYGVALYLTAVVSWSWGERPSRRGPEPTHGG